MMGRLAESFARAVGAVLQQFPYAGAYRYTVVSCNWGQQTLNLRPLESDQPALEGVRMRVPGIRLDIAPGTEVLVRYESLDATRPFVADFGTSPSSVLRADLLGGTTPIALQGHQIQITPDGFAAGAPVASLTTGTVTTSAIIVGTITGGSATIKGAS